jgi:hypothetical protein
MIPHQVARIETRLAELRAVLPLLPGHDAESRATLTGRISGLEAALEDLRDAPDAAARVPSPPAPAPGPAEPPLPPAAAAPPPAPSAIARALAVPPIPAPPPQVWTAERNKALEVMWNRGDKTDTIFTALNDMPGAPIASTAALSHQLKKMRAEGVHLVKRGAGGSIPQVPQPPQAGGPAPTRLSEKQAAVLRDLWHRLELTGAQILAEVNKADPEGFALTSTTMMSTEAQRLGMLGSRYAWADRLAAEAPATLDAAATLAKARALLREAHPPESITARTGLTAEEVAALVTEAEATARRMLAGGSSTDEVSHAASLPPRRILALRAELQAAAREGEAA